MLIEIHSAKFRTGAVPFHPGLNVILGDANATNSIGKSTMLMVIDFVFGGSDLLDHNSDVVKELGHHDYRFTFQFGDELHRFCRETSQPDVVYRCGSDFELGAPMSLENYTAFLRLAYEVELPDLSFRGLVGLYSRIWGKENLDPSKPLHIVPSKSGEECVEILIKTFDLYADLRDIDLKLNGTEKELKAWGSAKSQKVIPIIQKRGYDENQKSIATLESELSDIRVNLARYTANVSEVVNRELLELKAEKDRLLALRLSLASRLQRVQSNLRGNRVVRSESFQELVRFFPAIDQERLARVGDFHSGVARLLRSELAASQSQLEEELAAIDEELASLDERMGRSLNTVEAPTALVDRVAEVATKIKGARDENGRYEHEVALRADVKRLKEQLQKEKETILIVLEKTINDGMRRIMTERFGTERKSPFLELRERGYRFEVDEDTGTGVAYTGLVLFDLTIFLLTRLPILIHDTVIFKNIENDSVSRLLPVYLETEKQSFVALDEIEKYGSETVALLKQHQVLELDTRNLLYIKDWRARTEERSAVPS
ncbi:DUF2326 domain-containing protein [Granulicella sp. L60]|uniref:DUF2326 domain-containing protein n=1 Tax=Granulicella sp. L60 TaxID=1641866 RepID=UPI00131E11F3|nr:DUF2326 domain-containing protein [Granulicella sp. L60]